MYDGTTDGKPLGSEQIVRYGDRKVMIVRTYRVGNDDTFLIEDIDGLPTITKINAAIDQAQTTADNALTSANNSVKSVTGNLVDNTDAKNPAINGAISKAYLVSNADLQNTNVSGVIISSGLTISANSVGAVITTWPNGDQVAEVFADIQIKNPTAAAIAQPQGDVFNLDNQTTKPQNVRDMMNALSPILRSIFNAGGIADTPGMYLDSSYIQSNGTVPTATRASTFRFFFNGPAPTLTARYNALPASFAAGGSYQIKMDQVFTIKV